MKVSYLFATAAWWLAFASAAAIKEPPADETEISAGSKGLAKRDSVEKPRFPEPKYFRKRRAHPTLLQEHSLTITARGITTAPLLTYNVPRQYVHYDARFGDGPLKETEQRDAIRILIQTYLATFRDLGVQTWLMHGTLLGWWWGKKARSPDLCSVFSSILTAYII
ncbi:mannosyltransferase [Neonectria magnoliae]|uniref:Mannosyltransferase n=1 Tax=Neonectria magnoliae TaxID=2732573 RepID=A0ABR1IBF1_9HYPO